MNARDRRNVAHPDRTHRGGRPAAALLLAILAGAPALSSDPGAASTAAAPQSPETAVPPPARPPQILVPPLPPSPAPGKGRMTLHIGGNRRWCTFPDDRLVRPSEREGRMEKRNQVFTFGYKFTIAAVRRGDADSVVMLFESPVYRTASWRPASKVGAIPKTKPRAPLIVPEGQPLPKPKPVPQSPDTLVAYWEPQNRCVGFPERMDFDLDPGTYDVYAAFDLVKGDGTWVHRSMGFLTDIPVEAARHTLLDGLINMGAATERQVEIRGFSLEGLPGPAGS